MHVFCNGERKELEGDVLADAIAVFGFDDQRVAVAVNETFVPKAEWPVCRLRDGDRIDVLAAIEGG